MEIDYDNLDYVVSSWVETFNDCACCPVYLECDKAGIDTTDCAKEIVEKFLKKA